MAAREKKRSRLAAKSSKPGTAQEVPGPIDEEAAYVDLKMRLAMGLRDQRERRSLTPADLARRLRVSQSRVAEMEAGDASVSLDLLVRSLLALGISRAELSRLISDRSTAP